MMTSDYSKTSTYSKVFNSGNSQAVRIPANLRLETNKVKITQLPDGRLLIEPIFDERVQERGQLLLSVLAEFDDDFIAALEDSASDALPMQERDGL